MTTELFDITQVADGVYAAVAAPTYKVNSNAAIISDLTPIRTDYHHHGLARRQRLETRHVRFQPPRNGAAGPDHAVLRDRNDENDFHYRVPCASAVRSGPPTRQIVHSSISSAPSDL